ncbi:MAG: D-aminoacylase [Dehalococcoidia bacterium]|nr:D-aminoacylase [Dehalococcoidia bacterium]MDW8119518.1 D-aminoacylase [Chloroflexota bacterium]
MPYDLLIRNGDIYDGTGAPPFRADIGIVGGRIVAIGLLESPSHDTLDATGLAVAPGFIDVHTHSDISFLVDADAQSKVRQGVTLELAGNCGMSMGAPLIGEARRSLQDRVNAYGVPFTPDWTTFGEYLERVEKARPPLNVACQVGHGSVRMAVLGWADRAPTPQELDTMRSLVADSLEAGALGFSTGLFYAPGSYARTEEVIELAKEAGKRGKIYSTHIRDEGDVSVGLFSAVQEAIEIGRMAGVRVQVSHLKCMGPFAWGKADMLLERLEKGRAEGVDVAGDQYPYTAGSTYLAAIAFPRWAQVGGRETLLHNLQDAAFQARLRAATAENYTRRGGAERVVIAYLPSRRDLEGFSIAQIAERWGVDPVEATLRIYQEGEAFVIIHQMEERDVERIAAYPWSAVASDGSSLRAEGPLSAGKPHPRSYGCFPRFLARYWRERRCVSLEEAVRKMTSLPATRLGLTHRGRIAPGYWADIVCFDPRTVADTATFQDPHRYPQGIPHVVVNGIPVVRNGEYTGRRPGRVIRRFDD